MTLLEDTFLDHKDSLSATHIGLLKTLFPLAVIEMMLKMNQM